MGSSRCIWTARGGRGCLEVQSFYPQWYVRVGNEENLPNFYGSLNALIDKTGPAWTIIIENVQTLNYFNQSLTKRVRVNKTSASSFTSFIFGTSHFFRPL